MQEMIKTGRSAKIIAEELNLIKKSDAGELEAIVEQVLTENQKAVDDVKVDGKKKQKGPELFARPGYAENQRLGKSKSCFPNPH